MPSRVLDEFQITCTRERGKTFTRSFSSRTHYSGSRGAWARPPLPPKSCSFQAILMETPYFGLRAHPLGTKLCWVTLTKILDPPLAQPGFRAERHSSQASNASLESEVFEFGLGSQQPCTGGSRLIGTHFNRNWSLSGLFPILNLNLHTLHAFVEVCLNPYFYSGF